MAKSQKTNRDHAKKTTKPMVEDEEIASQLSALLTPAITSQENYYRQLGLRGRILNLPLMVAAVLTLLWRDVSGVTALTRMLARAGFLWCRPRTVTQQAMSQRFLSFPATLFEGVFKNLLRQFKNCLVPEKPATFTRKHSICLEQIFENLDSIELRRSKHCFASSRAWKIYLNGSWQLKWQQL